MSDVVQTIAILTPTLTVAGGAIAWLWNKVEARFHHIDVELEKCRAREHVSNERRSALITIIELLWRAVEREAPESGELQRVQKLMDDYKAIGSHHEEDKP